jgi:hypothetical protein
MSGDGSGNKKIVIGVLVALALCSACCCGGVAVFGVGAGAAGMQAMNSLEPVMKPVAKASDNPQIIELLGAPIEKAPMLKSGNINLKNDDGIADYSWGLKGPKGEGTLVVKATRTAGKWTYTTARVDVGEQSIDLMPMD